MKYSIIIPYRNRESHLEILLPILHEKFKDKDYEIIVSEQNDTDNFRIACVQNAAVKYATGDVLLFHQVDYVPWNDVSYEISQSPVLPAYKGFFVNTDFTDRPIEDIPAGYRSWSTRIDPLFHGGLILMKKEHFMKINGFNPLYRGWGNEDIDLACRLQYHEIPAVRNNTGTFYVLHHTDNCPPPNEEERYMDFVAGTEILSNFMNYIDIGYTNQNAETVMFETEDSRVTWLYSTNYKIDVPDEMKQSFGPYWNKISK